MSAITTFVQPIPAVTIPASRRYMLLALSTLGSTLLLIAMGSIVRVTGYGLGCPDWPLCYGQVVPPLQIAPWVEFLHRLIGAVASLQLIALGVVAWRSYRREPWIFAPAVATIGLLTVQIVLGGVHVLLEIPPTTGWIHTGVAMAIVGLVATQVAVTHPAARALSTRVATAVRHSKLPVVLAVTAGATYFLILTGAYVTRNGASLVCLAFPWCGTEAKSGLLRTLIEIQMLHRFTAFAVVFLVVLTLWLLVRVARDVAGLRAAALTLAALTVMQFGLGISNVLLFLPIWARVLHLVVAAILWAGLVMLWVVVRQGQTVK